MKVILVDMWVGNEDKIDGVEYIGKQKIESQHEHCYDAGESNFHKCNTCDIWVCYSHEESDHKCEGDNEI